MSIYLIVGIISIHIDIAMQNQSETKQTFHVQSDVQSHFLFSSLALESIDIIQSRRKYNKAGGHPLRQDKSQIPIKKVLSV